MNYYPHHIGDFRSGSVHMTRTERWIYRDLIEVYYDTEKPLPDNLEAICNMVGSRTEDDRKIVAELLLYKFEQCEDGYRHERCDAVIAEYHSKTVTAQTNGKRGGRPRKNNPEKPSGFQSGSNPVPLANPEQTKTNPDITGSQANQEPITNKEPIPHTPQAGPKPKAAIALQTYLDDCKRSGKKSIDEKHAVFEYAAKTGIPQEFLRIQWLEFKYRYTMDGAKRYKAWQTVFDKSVRGNWFKLWYATPDGQYALTTTGQQAMAAHREAA